MHCKVTLSHTRTHTHTNTSTHSHDASTLLILPSQGCSYLSYCHPLMYYIWITAEIICLYICNEYLEIFEKIQKDLGQNSIIKWWTVSKFFVWVTVKASWHLLKLFPNSKLEGGKWSPYLACITQEIEKNSTTYWLILSHHRHIRIASIIFDQYV